MKEMLLSLLVIFTPVLGIFTLGPLPVALPEEPAVYTNLAGGYELPIPAGFEVDDSIPELTVLRQGGSRLRVNAGCLEFGVEGLAKSALAVEVAGLPAMREDYYQDSVLRLRRFVVTKQGKCLALELYSDTDAGWEVLGQAVRDFRFLGSGAVELKGGSHAFVGRGGCVRVPLGGLGWAAAWHPVGP